MMQPRPLRIGITCFPLVGGSGILATALGMELAVRGHEVHFFSYAKPIRLDLSAPRIHFHEVAVGEHSVFPCPDYTLPLAVKMADVSRAERLDLLHVHYAVPHATAAFLATEMIGNAAPKIVTTLHGTDTTLLGPNPQYRPAIAHALMHSDAVTTVSESLRQQTLLTFQLSRPVEVVPNFFTPAAPTRSRQNIRHELGISDEFLVLHMSNLRPTKRVDLLLRIIAASVHRNGIRLLIIAGSRFDRYEALLDELGIRKNVIVRTAAEPIENYLNAADAGIYTSEIESFGLSILETMFFAKPVFAFGVGGIPETVGDAGSLHEFGDVSSMAAALDQFMQSPAAARNLGEKAHARAQSKFTAEQIVPRYEAIYRRVLD
ncbi:MAG TPA: N-acetyl-alpha-D-glucosaminyl L-malate synthase BshA [Chthoniobacterales bacterium]|nr:N-acetyl-alpha-D-glucosaminyl L-malate synthase BshA [Chthoniobacterales bacterium]